MHRQITHAAGQCSRGRRGTPASRLSTSGQSLSLGGTARKGDLPRESPGVKRTRPSSAASVGSRCGVGHGAAARTLGGARRIVDTRTGSRHVCTASRHSTRPGHNGRPSRIHIVRICSSLWSLFRGPLMLLMFPPFLTCLLPSWEAWGKSQASHRSPRRRSPPRAPCPPGGCGHSVSPQAQWRPHQGQSSCKQEGPTPRRPPDVIELPGFAPVSWVAHP